MRYYEDKCINLLDDWRKFVDDNKEHLPLLYEACQKNNYFKCAYSLHVRFYLSQEIDHPIGIAVYDEYENNKYFIYVLNAWDSKVINTSDNRRLLNSFLEKANSIEVTCTNDNELKFYSDRCFRLPNECNLIWTRGQNGNSV